MPVRNFYWQDGNKDPSPLTMHLVGPTVPVEAHVPAALAAVLTQQGKTLPPPGTGIGLIDTGATFSAIHKDIAVRLGLTPLRTITTGTAGGQLQQNVYPVRVSFPTWGLDFDPSTLTGVDLTGQAVDGKPIIMLVGRDLLATCVFTYNGPGGFYTISW